MKPVLPLSLVLLCSSVLGSCSSLHAKRDYNNYDYYVLEHDTTTGTSLLDVVNALHLEFVEAVGQLQDHWLLRRHRSGSLRIRGLDPLEILASHGRRSRTDLLTRSIKSLTLQTPRTRIKRDESNLRAPPSFNWENATSDEIAELEGISDPAFREQWHLVNNDYHTHMINVAPVWDMGITGEGVITAMVDDGLDFESDDLADNFDAPNSYDFNLHVDLPKPMLSDDHHGTRCAGQIAAVKNDVCGVGIAYKSKVAGIRILSGPISDVDEAAALNYGYQNTSIYSCSWGPADDGRSMEGPTFLIQKAVVNGVQNGRGGKGSIFVFASGNGAAQDDQCNFDGYTNSIYSVTVAAVDYKGLHPYYSEACAANMVVTYSSGSGKHIVTTDVGKNKCSSSHGGTSAAAPNAAGIFSLALSARPELSWRDIQHLCVNTAKTINPDDRDWEVTAAGRRFSYKYGYGSLDALAFVQAAQKWDLVKPQAWLHSDPIQLNNGAMSIDGIMSGGTHILRGGIESTTSFTEDMLRNANFAKLEHVTVKVWIQHARRGDVEIALVSPNGIKSVLAGRRKYDQDRDGYPGWTFMTVKHWDENPVGTWTIQVSDQNTIDSQGNLLGWTMTLWGSVVDTNKAETFVLADPVTAFPPNDILQDSPISTTSISASASTSKFYPKPTEHLPGDHGSAEGEADKPAFSSGDEDIAQPTTTPAVTPTDSLVPTPDEGWFPGMYNLVSNSKWVFGAIGIVAFSAVSGGIYFLWRRQAARKARYRSLASDDVPLHSSTRFGSRAAGTKELYDAFGEVSDDEDEYADEETGLRRDSPEFHSNYSDDHEVRSNYLGAHHYTDGTTEQDINAHSRGSDSPSSVDGSWEHADAS